MTPSILLFAALSLASPTGTASVPDPAHSTIPLRMVFCPDGDLSVELVIRDFANNPVSQSQVVLDFSPCATFTHCAQIFPPGVTNLTLDAANHVMGTTDQDGRILIRLAMTGNCLSGSFPVTLRVYADGVSMGLEPAYPYLMSPDQNGDRVVDAADEAIMNDRIASSTVEDIRVADLTGDGVLDDADLAYLRTHMNHVCNDPTPAQRSSWGKLKQLYR